MSEEQEVVAELESARALLERALGLDCMECVGRGWVYDAPGQSRVLECVTCPRCRGTGKEPAALSREEKP